MTLSAHDQRSIDLLLQRGKTLADINQMLRMAARTKEYDPQLFSEIRRYARQRILEIDEGAKIEREISADVNWLRGE